LMNSRGTLMSRRSTGDMLASSDRVAMTPTVQPATAGTQWYREVGRLMVTVTGREDMRSTRELSLQHADGYPAGASALLDSQMRPSRRRPGTASGVPLPPLAKECFRRLNGPVTGTSWCLFCGRRRRLRPRSVGTGPCFPQGLFADGVVFRPLNPDGLEEPVATGKRTREAPSALRPASTSASAYLKSD
jgi:hypothetical protein